MTKLSALSARLKEPFTPQYQHSLAGEMIDTGRTAPHNCRELMETNATVIPSRDLDWDGHTDDRGLLTGRCSVIQLLQSAKPSRFCYLSKLPWNPATFALLPAGVAWVNNDGDLYAAAEAEKRSETILQLHSGSSVKQDGEFLHESNHEERGFGSDYNVVAKGDFTGDGLEDWLLEVSGGPISQGHLTFHVFMITKKSAFGRIQFLQRVF